MLAPDVKFKQLESLVQTTTTKQQILEKVEGLSAKELQRIIPEVPDGMAKDLIVENVKATLSGNKTLDIDNAIPEKIVLRFGRPVFFVRDGRPVAEGEDIAKFKALIENGVANLGLLKSIYSIGRIEVNNHPNYLWVGTGWIFAKNLLVTNRHVAETFIDNSGSRFRFRKFFNDFVEARVDFLAEYENPNAAEFTIVDCLFIGQGQYEDVAILRVNIGDPTFEPLSILNNAPLKLREDIAVVGYPAYDSQTALMEDMQRIFRGVYDYKRFAPGKITQLYANEGVIVHDASTLGGNSGSALISLETGKVLGLHFAGKESSGNYCLDAPSLLRIINQIPMQSFFAVTDRQKSAPSLDSISFEANRSCKLSEYKNYKVPSFEISGRIVTYASPDSTFHVTKKFFAKAKESILIGIYDFTAEHVYSCIVAAIDRGVHVSVMLDLENEKEAAMWKKLKRYGVECVQAPSCTSPTARYFASSHEKVIVIDEKWVMIQSGNYSDRSCPHNELDGDASEGFVKGNRDMGVVLESKPLARFFTKVLRDDMKLQLSGLGLEGFEAAPLRNDFLIEAPEGIPDPLFPSREFNPEESIKIQPVLTPDNYIDEISELLKSAKKSIKIEQQYIRVDHNHIKDLLACIPDNIKVQIILAQPMGDDFSRNKTQHEFDVLQNEYGYDVRFLSRQFSHCHNKLIIVDEETVVISSQNWSNTAVATNREAGVIIYDREITRYFKKIFDADWTMSDNAVEARAGLIPELNLESLGREPGRYLMMDGGDIKEV